MNLILLVFKIIRKIGSEIERCSFAAKMYYFKVLYAKRCIISNDTIFFAKGWIIQCDISESVLVIQHNVIARNNFFIYCGNSGKIQIGNNVFFNNSCSINCMESITIGNDCQFGENVKMYDHNHAYKNKALPINQQGYVSGAITIGNNCWIGSNVTILRNVQIGNNVVVGAGCVVAKSIPDNTVVVHQQNLHSFSY